LEILYVVLINHNVDSAGSILENVSQICRLTHHTLVIDLREVRQFNPCKVLKFHSDGKRHQNGVTVEVSTLTHDALKLLILNVSFARDTIYIDKSSAVTELTIDLMFGPVYGLDVRAIETTIDLDVRSFLRKELVKVCWSKIDPTSRISFRKDLTVFDVESFSFFGGSVVSNR
jgi:hypothetical protein